MNNHRDLRGSPRALRLEGGPLEIRYIRTHKARYRLTRTPARLTELRREPLRTTWLVVQQIAALLLVPYSVTALTELRGIQYIHRVGPTVMRLLNERILVVPVRLVHRFRPREWRVAAGEVLLTK